MFYASNSVENRALENFFQTVRQNLDDIESPGKVAPSEPGHDSSQLKDHEIYGVIDKKEFQAILSSYDEKSQEPTICNRFEAGSFAKLLFSKPGFHNPGSTDYLIRDLNIKDTGRSSFLGGHSTYEVPQGMTLNDALQRQRTLCVRATVKDILKRLDNSEQLDTILPELEEIREPNDGNYCLATGRYLLKIRAYPKAIEHLRKSLEIGCDYVEQAKKYLAEALFERGFILFNSGEYEQAQDLFIQSFGYDNSEKARIHFEMSGAKIREQRRPFGVTNNMVRRR